MSKNYMLYNGIDIEIEGYSVYPHCGNNDTDKMVCELIVKNKVHYPKIESSNLKIEISQLISAQAMREMAEKLIDMANNIDSHNQLKRCE